MKNNESNGPLEFHLKYRPKMLKEVVGQSEAVKTIQAFLKNSRVPHSILFTGPSGCGKTTLARILADKLGCKDADLYEVNAATTRGIDFVRDVRSNLQLPPIGSPCRVYLLDECFPGNTRVNIPEGTVEISQIKEGAEILNLEGKTSVEKIFVNKVALDRVIRLEFDDGSVIFTTKEHEFLTSEGWVRSGDLTKEDVIFTLMRQKNERKSMPVLSEEIPADVLGVSREKNVLFKEMRQSSKSRGKRARNKRRNRMPVLPKEIPCDYLASNSSQVLLKILCSETQTDQSRFPREILQRNSQEENQRLQKRILRDEQRKSSAIQSLQKNDLEESHAQTGNNRQNDLDEERKRNLKRVFWNSWWKRAVYQGSKQAEKSAREVLDKRVVDFNEGKTTRISPLLQSRSWKEEVQNCNRNRWERTSVEKKYIEGCKENPETRGIRLVSAEIYKRGCNDSSFLGIISDRDRSRGYAEFYDLQIKSHPSYFVNNIPVHNCHQLTNEAQTALLKMLEDTPRHVYFFLATTLPDKIIKTVRTRCTEVQTKAVSEENLSSLLLAVIEKEEVKVSKDVIDKITEQSDGSPRQALNLLNRIAHLQSEEEQLDAIIPQETKKAAIELCRALMNPKSTWAEVKVILKSIEKEEPESLRWMMLGYCRSVLLNADGGKAHLAYLVGNAFRDNFYDSKHAGIALASWEVLQSRKER